MSYETVQGLIAIVNEAVEKSQRMESKISHEVAMLRGMASPKIRHFLNNLCSHGPCNYLEIGTYGGSTLVPALYNNDVIGLAIDNWSQFGPEECGGYNAREALNENLTKYGTNFKQYEIANEDCFNDNALTIAGSKVKWNVFFYDGAHDEEATQKAIELYGKICNNPFILVVDDFELADSVKIGISKGMLSFDIHYTWHLKKSDAYHEGVFIAVLSHK